jgi:hypothetical protein
MMLNAVTITTLVLVPLKLHSRLVIQTVRTLLTLHFLAFVAPLVAICTGSANQKIIARSTVSELNQARLTARRLTHVPLAVVHLLQMRTVFIRFHAPLNAVPIAQPVTPGSHKLVGAAANASHFLVPTLLVRNKTLALNGLQSLTNASSVLVNKALKTFTLNVSAPGKSSLKTAQLNISSLLMTAANRLATLRKRTRLAAVFN